MPALRQLEDLDADEALLELYMATHASRRREAIHEAINTVSQRDEPF